MLDCRETTHVENTTQVAIAHLADSFSATHRTAAGMFTGSKASKSNQLAIITDLFKAIGVNDQEGRGTFSKTWNRSDVLDLLRLPLSQLVLQIFLQLFYFPFHFCFIFSRLLSTSFI